MLKLVARAGMLGPLLFGFVVATLTILKYDFLLTLGWHPLRAPTFDWPSGLALGDYGWIMTLTFLTSGLMLTLFASGLRLSLPRIRLAAISIWLLVLAGVGMIGLISPTDKTISRPLRTRHGILHDSSFVVIGLTLLPAMILLGFVFRKDERWEDLAVYTWITAALAIPTFWMKGLWLFTFFSWPSCSGVRWSPCDCGGRRRRIKAEEKLRAEAFRRLHF